MALTEREVKIAVWAFEQAALRIKATTENLPYDASEVVEVILSEPCWHVRLAEEAEKAGF